MSTEEEENQTFVKRCSREVDKHYINRQMFCRSLNRIIEYLLQFTVEETVVDIYHMIAYKPDQIREVRGGRTVPYKLQH